MSYDRIFDLSFLANETLQGNFAPQTTFLNIAQNVAKMMKGKLGKVFVKYAQPLKMDDFIAQLTPPALPDQQAPQPKLEEMSMQLTKSLYQIQQKEQPVTMNSIIAACIFYQPPGRTEVTFKTIKQAAQVVYKSLLDKDCRNYISILPQNFDIESVASKLGYEIQGNPLDRAKGDQALIVLKEKDNWNKMLGMSYYSNQLSVFFSLESIFVHSLSFVLDSSKAEVKGGMRSARITEVEQTASFMIELFRNEFLIQERFDRGYVHTLFDREELGKLKMLTYDRESETVGVFET
mmetsp:Transcript_10027/g.16865  ORF Transcript_10027/g.16865 Transcript_10027/m.16865 type:complete len:292 (-) Transcript_10027:477-1352(-)